jgi:PDZ domain-containing protein
MRIIRRFWWLVPIVGLVLVAGSVWLPYYSIGPGPARDVEPLIHVQGTAVYPSDGSLILTSIVFSQLTGLGVLEAWLDPDVAVVPRERVYPSGETVEVEQQRSISQMDQSKLDATYVVMHQLTHYPRDHGAGVLVESIVSGCAADGELFPGDLIQRIDGQEVNTVRASAAIGDAPSGSTLRFDVTVDGKPQTVRLVRAPCGGEKQPLVGVSLINDFPYDVTISSAGIGGPSAGLMWALGLYDLLTPGDLTNGRTVAGTGEIGLDGRVYPIGGIEEKIVAAAHAGASVFLVPADNAAAARASGTRGMTLVPIETFEDALTYLEGGSAGTG